MSAIKPTEAPISTVGHVAPVELHPANLVKTGSLAHEAALASAPLAPGRNVHFESQDPDDFQPMRGMIRAAQVAARATTWLNNRFAKPSAAEPLLAANRELSSAAKAIRQARAEGLELPASAVAAVEAHGFSAEHLPGNGTLLVDPYFNGDVLAGGKVSGAAFKAATSQVEVRPPLETMFAGRSRPFTFQDSSGVLQSFKSPDEYRSYVAQQRAARGLPQNDGEPVGVQVNFEGGGGKWMRFDPVYAEMMELGIVPTSVAGSSVGSLAAAFVAAGADPQELASIMASPEMAAFSKFKRQAFHGGLLDGKALHDFTQKTLGDLLGIHDRPVLFSDLKMPSQMLATVAENTDSSVDLTWKANRTFVFGPHTTPSTPVALGARASMAIPVGYRPVHATDVFSGHTMTFTDSGSVNLLPVGYGPEGLPQVNLSLLEKGTNHPRGATVRPSVLPSVNLAVDNIFVNAFNSAVLHDGASAHGYDFAERVHPRAGEFSFSAPIWDVENPKEGDGTTKFARTAEDDALDQQTRGFAREFFTQNLTRLQDPAASASNVTDELPHKLSFQEKVRVDGREYNASYDGGKQIRFVSEDGQHKFRILVRPRVVEATYLDGQSFGHLSERLAAWASKPRRLPF